MSGTFSDNLAQFAQAVDIVTEEIWEEVMRLVESYVNEALHMNVLVLFIRHQVDGRPGLTTIWNNAGYSWSHALRDESGDYKGQVSFAYSTKKRLWILSKDRESLDESTAEYVDCFRHGDSEEIPRYVPAHGRPTRTSVYLPIVVPRRDESSLFDQGSHFSPNSEVVGLLNLESPEHIPCSTELKKEVVKISGALSLIYQMKETHVVQSHGTRLARNALEIVLQRDVDDLKRRPLVGKYGLFLATPGESSDDVIGVIRDILDDYGHVVEPYYWREDAQGGNIHAQLWEHIERCRCGIFYLSQLAQNTEHTYADNPNVLFEAGMMHALLGGDPTRSALILVREEASPNIPFDLLAERRLTVPRDSEGRLNREAFRSDLKGRLDRILVAPQ